MERGRKLMTFNLLQVSAFSLNSGAGVKPDMRTFVVANVRMSGLTPFLSYTNS